MWCLHAPATRALLICLLVGAALLGACRPGDVATIATPPATPPATLIVPSPTPPQAAPGLPLDQPWALVASEAQPCGAGIYSSDLLAVGPGGRLTRSSLSVTAHAERPGAPPLLATCAADGTAALFDPLSGRSVRLPFPPGVMAYGMVVSPDGRHALVQVGCWLSAGCADASQAPLVENQLIDLASGEATSLPAFPTSYSIYGSSLSIGLLAWGDAGVYYMESRNKAGGTSVRVLDPYDTQGGGHALDVLGWHAFNSAHGLLAATSWSPEPQRLTLSDLRSDTSQEIDRAGWLSPPAIAPDGSAVAYLRSSQYPSSDQARVDLVLFDLARNTMALIGSDVGTPFGIANDSLGDKALFWSRDSQRLIVTTQIGSNAQASLLTRDGALINRALLPWGQLLGISADDQLILDQGDDHQVSWLPLRPGARPYAPRTTFNNAAVRFIYSPPPAAAAAPPAPAVPQPPTLDVFSLPKATSIPTDLPWLFAHNGYDLCPAVDRVSYMIAIDRAGQLTRLSQIVTAYAERPGAPPLLLACGSDGSASLLDPQGWTSIPLDLEPGTRISQMVVSPDQGRAALLTMCQQGAGCNDGQAAQLIQIVDLRTGALSIGATMATSSGSGPYHISGTVTLLGWGQAGLYYSVTYSKAGGSYLVLIDPDDPQAAARELADERDYTLDCAHDLLVKRSWSSGAAGLSVFDLRHGTRQLIDQGPGLSMPAIAPDGSALAYLRRSRGSDSGAAPRTELVRFDLARSTQTILAANLGVATEMQIVGSMQTSTIWSQDSQRIVAVTQGAQGGPQASLLTRDGVLISTLPLPNSRLLGVTADDQLVLEQSDGVGVSWLPIRAGAAPYAAPIGPIAGYLVAAPFLPPAPSVTPLPDSKP